jgi:hypothetical protein
MLRVVVCTTAVVLCAAGSARALSERPQEPSASLVARYRDVIRDAATPDERDETARAFVKSLPPRDQLVLARALAAGARQDDAVFGAGLLVERGLSGEAAPAFARFVAAGGDMTAHFWKWAHGEDPKTAIRAYIAIARRLLARIDTLAGEPRRRAEAFLIDAGHGPPIPAYSRKAVEDRLAALEREIR